jgi:hypothetical protein
VYEPEFEYVIEFADHVYELHAITDSEPVELLLIVRLSVAIESHPAAFVNVAVYEPEFEYVIEFADHVYELHAVTDSEPVELLLIVKFSVAIESHPAAFVNVAVYEPEFEYVIEFADHVYELHAVTDSEPVELLLTVKFNIAIESHPAAFVNVAVYEPEFVYVIEFADHVYELHAVTDSEPVELLLTVKFNVAIESHPAAFVNVAVYEPEFEYVIEFADHVYELHAVTDSEPDELLLTVKFSVAIESHPAAFVNVAV